MSELVRVLSELPPLEADLRALPGATRTAYVIWNPSAGSGLLKRRIDIESVVRRFQANGWSVATVKTRCAGDGTEAARFARASGADVVVAMGGDGTINEVVQALAKTETPLGIVPAGTINVLSQEIGLPSDPLECVDRIATGTPTAIDLGVANGRYFTMMIGLGYDGEALNTLIPSLKQVSGPLAYWVAGFQSWVKHKSVRTQLIVDDGRKVRRMRRLVYMMVVSNAGLYAGGVLKFTPEASIRDGLLDACVISAKRWYKTLGYVVLTLFGRLKNDSNVDFFMAKKITMRTARPFPYQLDGDPAGMAPVVIEAAPLALRVIAGPHFDAPQGALEGAARALE